MPDQQQPAQDIPEPPKSVAAVSSDYEGGVAGQLGGDKTQTAGTQQPAAAPAAQPKRKKPAYDGPGLQRPQSSGFMQQLTGVVNQGKNLMRSDINARMGAWHDATQHPERASEFLKSVFGDDETDEEVAEIAAEEGPDDFEAPGIKHMKDTKKERNAAIQPIVQDKNKIRGADNLGYRIGYNNSPDGSIGFFGATDGGVGAWDAGVDMASYLEDLMNKGIIDADQYLKARRTFDEGKTLGNFDRRLEEQAIKRMSEKRPKLPRF